MKYFDLSPKCLFKLLFGFIGLLALLCFIIQDPIKVYLFTGELLFLFVFCFIIIILIYLLCIYLGCRAQWLDNYIFYIVFPLIPIPQLAQYIVIIILVTIVLMLYLLPCGNFVTTNLCFLAPSPLSHTAPIPSSLATTNPLSVCMRLSILFVHLFCSVYSIYK